MKTLERIATIDYCYWCLGKLNEKLSKPKPSIVQMVDKACGYDEVEEIRKEAISLVECIIENKKAINADYSGDSELLDNLKKRRNE